MLCPHSPVAAESCLYFFYFYYSQTLSQWPGHWKTPALTCPWSLPHLPWRCCTGYRLGLLVEPLGLNPLALPLTLIPIRSRCPEHAEQVFYKVNQTVLPCDLNPGKLTRRMDWGRCAKIPKDLPYVKHQVCKKMRERRGRGTQQMKIQRETLGSLGTCGRDSLSVQGRCLVIRALETSFSLLNYRWLGWGWGVEYLKSTPPFPIVLLFFFFLALLLLSSSTQDSKWRCAL